MQAADHADDGFFAAGHLTSSALGLRIRFRHTTQQPH
jgi:hypothetical protein